MYKVLKKLILWKQKQQQKFNKHNLIKGAFQLDRYKKKSRSTLFAKTKSKIGKMKVTKRANTIFPFRFKRCRVPREYTLIIIIHNPPILRPSVFTCMFFSCFL